MNKKIYILVGHPNSEQTLNSTLAQSYEKGARDAHFEVRRTHLAELHFDPILHKGYKEIQELEPDLIKVQEDMKWADHIVIFYPVWWSTVPALLKGMLDRMFLPGFAFNFIKGKPLRWKKLLSGRSARLVVTSNAFPVVSRFISGDSANEIRKGILKFSGIAPIKVTRLWRVEGMEEARFKRLKDKLYKLGKKGM